VEVGEFAKVTEGLFEGVLGGGEENVHERFRF
jgi:hypothetical protein